MNIEAFQVEEWMNAYEGGARYNIAETCVDSISLNELFTLTGEDRRGFWDSFCSKRMTYGDIEGAPLLKEGICRLYKMIEPQHIVTTHGAAGANHHIFYSMINPGDRIISILPTYQQLYAIPESYGADVKRLYLSVQDDYQIDLEALRRLAVPGTKMICLNNPNNPTGALLSKEILQEIIRIARQAGAYILCDEVYRHLTQDDEWSESIVDLYEKGISVSSMSKVFSLAGLRLGWIVSRDMEVIRSCFSHRDYNLISGGMFDEAAAGIALKYSEQLLERSRSIIRTNLEILDHWVSTQPGVYYQKPQAGTTALVYYHADIPSDQFCRELYHQTGALVTPGVCFEMEHCIRIGYAGETEMLKAGLSAVSHYLETCLTV
ncbi:MAG: aminotransferase [Lachnospiraceae bacterium]